MNNVTNNNDLLNFTARTDVKAKSSGTFKAFMQKQEAQIDNKDKVLYGNDALEKFNSIKKYAQTKEISSEKENEDSRCCDSELEELVDGIVGILEGFGLLDYNTDESTIDELSKQIASMVNGEAGSIDMTELMDKMKMLSDVIARMPNANELEPLTQEVTQMVEKLVSEYQCSFDNTNNMGVKDADLTEKLDPNKLKLMIKSAIAEMNGSKTKQISFAKQKSQNNENGTEDMGKGSSTLLQSKNSSETLKTTETVADPSVAKPSQEEAAENIAKIAERITASRLDGKREFDVTLKPSNLGKLSIKLIMDGDGIKAQIKASDLFVKGIISEQLPELSQALRDKGVNMENIEVIYDNPMFSSTDQQFQGQRQFENHTGQNMRSFMAGNILPEDIEYNAMMDNTDLSAMNSSVEFIA